MDPQREERVDDGTVGPAANRDAAFWAKGVSRLSVSEVDAAAVNRNVEGRRVMSPIQGFGRMWQKTYRVRLDGVGASPAEVIRTWKDNLASFWPADSRFFGPLTGIVPGEVAVLNITMPGKRTCAPRGS